MAKVLHELEAYEKLAQCVKKTFKWYEYHIIVSFARAENGEYCNNGFSISSLGEQTSLRMAKFVVSNSMQEYKKLRKLHDIDETEEKQRGR